VSRTLKSGETDNPKSGGIGSNNSPKIISPCITTENAHIYGDNVTVRQTEAIDKVYKAHRANEIREHKESPTLTQNMETDGNNVPMVARCLDANMHKGITPKHYYEKKKRNVVSVTEGRTEEAKRIRKEHMKKTGKDWSPRREKELIARDDDQANCITVGTTKEQYLAESKNPEENSDKDKIIVYDKLRRLTPVECERLQGFPDGWTDGVSDTQRYRQLGNAVTTNVITAIGNKLVEWF
jgi:DNA (cytosine-5)-methyltransferase 1